MKVHPRAPLPYSISLPRQTYSVFLLLNALKPSGCSLKSSAFTLPWPDDTSLTDKWSRKHRKTDTSGLWLSWVGPDDLTVWVSTVIIAMSKTSLLRTRQAIPNHTIGSGNFLAYGPELKNKFWHATRTPSASVYESGQTGPLTLRTTLAALKETCDAVVLAHTPKDLRDNSIGNPRGDVR